MIKRLICLELILITIMLSGCKTQQTDYEEPENRIYISSLGIDRQNDEISVCAEAVTVAENISADEYKIKRFLGTGSSIEAAMYEITNDLALSVNLSHCAVVTVGKGIYGEYLSELLEYCFLNNEITHSINFVSTENAEKLLEPNEDTTKPLGYEISDFLKEDIDGTDSHKSSTLVSIMNRLQKENDFFFLPLFQKKDNEFLCKGVTVFKGSSPLCTLSRNEYQFLKIASGDFLGGSVKILAEEEEYILDITRAKTDFKWNTDPNFHITVDINLKTESKNYNKEKLQKAVEENVAGVIIKFRDEYGTDIFEYTDKLNVESAKERFKIFLNSQVTVRCNIEGGGV